MMHTMSRKNMESKAGGAPICFRAHAPWRTPRSGHVPAGTNTSNTSNTTCQTNSNDRSDVSMLPSWRSLAHGAARSKVRDEEGVELSGLLPLESLAEHKLSIRVEAMNFSRHWKVFI